MRKICVVFAVLFLLLLIVGCGPRGDIGVIGGADGPTKIIVAGPHK